MRHGAGGAGKHADVRKVLFGGHALHSFDIEVIFLYPWAVVYKAMLRDPATHNLIFVSMFSFLAILLVGYIYALKKGAFDWKR